LARRIANVAIAAAHGPPKAALDFTGGFFDVESVAVTAVGEELRTDTPVAWQRLRFETSPRELR